MPNRSEALFEAFCESNGLAVERVPTASALGERRPDFRVSGPDGGVFFAEVKEVTPNRAEAKQIRRITEGRLGSFSTTPGDKLRQLIVTANRQLRPMTAGGVPGVLVVYNTDSFLRHHTEPYAVLTAMRGLDVVPVVLAKDPRVSPEFLDMQSGGSRGMRSDANTNVSAIAVATETPAPGWHLSVYHNRFAACPLPLGLLASPFITHYSISLDERSWDMRNNV